LTSYKFDEDEATPQAELIFDVPANSKKLLLVGIAEKLCDKIVVKATAGIDKCFVSEEKADQKIKRYTVQTEGVNFEAIWRYSKVVDVNNIDSNDIYAILRTYGVEAARNAITEQISAVFSVYGISVDTRHLGLVADYMTFGGDYKALSRIGIETNVSPLLKMSFETTMHFFNKLCFKWRL